MVLSLVLLVLGVVVVAAGLWWLSMLGATFTAIVAALVVAIGGALIVAALGLLHDNFSPTSRKL